MMTDRPTAWIAGAMIAAALLPAPPLAAQEAAPPAPAAANAAARPKVADMSCAALKAEMDEHSARTQQASDAMQAATAEMMAAQTREGARQEKRRRGGSRLGLLSMGTQLAGFLPGGGVVAGLAGAAVGQVLSTATNRDARGDAASARDLAEAQRKGQEASAIAIGQQAHIGRMQEVLTALTARKCV